MLTVAKLLEALDGLDPDAQVVVGIISGTAYNAAYAEQQVRGTAVALGPDHHELRGQAPALYICCYEEPLPWEGPAPEVSGDGTATLEYDPQKDEPDPGPPSSRAAA